MAETQPLTLEAVARSAAEKAQTPTSDAAAATTPSKATAAEPQPSKATGEDDGLTPNLRRIKASWAEDDEFAKLPKEAQQVLLKKAEQYDKGFHKDKTEIAGLRSLQNQLSQAGITLEALQSALSRPANPTSARLATSTAKEAETQVRGLNRLLKGESDAATREAIRELQTSLTEEVEDLLERHPKAKELAESVNRMERMTLEGRLAQADTEIDALESEYTTPLIEQYRPKLRAAAARPEFTKLSMEDILYKLVPAKELKEARQYAQTSSTDKGKASKTSAATVTTATANSDDLAKFRNEKTKEWNLSNLVSHLVGRAQETAGVK